MLQGRPVRGYQQSTAWRSTSPGSSPLFCSETLATREAHPVFRTCASLSFFGFWDHTPDSKVRQFIPSRRQFVTTTPGPAEVRSAANRPAERRRSQGATDLLLDLLRQRRCTGALAHRPGPRELLENLLEVNDTCSEAALTLLNHYYLKEDVPAADFEQLVRRH